MYNIKVPPNPSIEINTSQNGIVSISRLKAFVQFGVSFWDKKSFNSWFVKIYNKKSWWNPEKNRGKDP